MAKHRQASATSGPAPKRRARETRTRANEEQESFRLLDLPLEMRQMVYAFYFLDRADESQPTGIRINAAGRTPGRRAGPWDRKYTVGLPPRARLALLRASRQLHREATAVLFGTCTLVFAGVIALQEFLFHAHPAALARVRRAAVRLQLAKTHIDAAGPATFALLRGATGLQRLTLAGVDMSDLPLAETPGMRRAAPDQRLFDIIGAAVASRLYRFCRPFIQALVRDRGVDAVERLLDVADPALVYFSMSARMTLGFRRELINKRTIAMDEELVRRFTGAHKAMCLALANFAGYP